MPRGEGSSDAKRRRPSESTDAMFSDLNSELLAEEDAADQDVFARDTALPPAPSDAGTARPSAPSDAPTINPNPGNPNPGNPKPGVTGPPPPATAPPPAITLAPSQTALATTTATQPPSESDPPALSTVQPNLTSYCPSDAPTAPPTSSRARRLVLPRLPAASQPRLSQVDPSGEASALAWLNRQPEHAASEAPAAGFRQEPAARAPAAANQREMRERYALGDFTGSLEVAEAILESEPDHTEARANARDCRDILTQMYTAKVGPLDRVLRTTIDEQELHWLPLDHRAGFMLSLIDGQSTIAEILDISGMSRLSALKILSELCEQRVVAAS